MIIIELAVSDEGARRHFSVFEESLAPALVKMFLPSSALVNPRSSNAWSVLESKFHQSRCNHWRSLCEDHFQSLHSRTF
jgi:hypothetical protein